MSVNRDKPHVLVLPEDDANLRLANEFHLQIDWNRQRQMQVLPVAGGWTKVFNSFASDHMSEMDRYPLRYMVLLIDFDEKENRLEMAKSVIPGHLADRVFVLGAWNEPEDLRTDLGSYEEIGLGLAADCRQGTDTTWGAQASSA
jgi:hypothetical protein